MRGGRQLVFVSDTMCFHVEAYARRRQAPRRGRLMGGGVWLGDGGEGGGGGGGTRSGGGDHGGAGGGRRGGGEGFGGGGEGRGGWGEGGYGEGGWGEGGEGEGGGEGFSSDGGEGHGMVARDVVGNAGEVVVVAVAAARHSVAANGDREAEVAATARGARAPH